MALLDTTTPPPDDAKLPVKRRRGLRIAAWIAGSLVLLFILVIVGLGIYSTTQDFQNRVRSTLINTLQDATGGKVDLAKVQFSLMHLAVEADGLVIHGLEAIQVDNEQGSRLSSIGQLLDAVAEHQAVG